MTRKDIYRRLLAIQDAVTYDDLPTYKEAIDLLNQAAAYVTGLLETLHSDMQQGKDSHPS